MAGRKLAIEFAVAFAKEVAQRVLWIVIRPKPPTSPTPPSPTPSPTQPPPTPSPTPPPPSPTPPPPTPSPTPPPPTPSPTPPPSPSPSPPSPSSSSPSQSPPPPSSSSSWPEEEADTAVPPVVPGMSSNLCRFLLFLMCLLYTIERVTGEVSKEFFPEVAVGYDDPPVNLHIGDGVAFLNAARERTYDAVIVDSPDPIGSAQELFEKPFFESVAKALRPGDIVADIESNGVVFPPRFTSLVSSCSTEPEGPEQSELALALVPELQEPDLKSEMAKYMQDASFLGELAHTLAPELQEPDLKSQTEESIYYVIFVLMSAPYLYLALVLVPIVALIGDFLYQGCKAYPVQPTK